MGFFGGTVKFLAQGGNENGSVRSNLSQRRRKEHAKIIAVNPVLVERCGITIALLIYRHLFAADVTRLSTFGNGAVFAQMDP